MPLVGPLIGAVAPYLLETLVRKITGSGRRRTTRRVHRRRTGTSLRRVHRAGSYRVTGQGRSRRVHRHRRVTSGYGVRRVGRPRRVGRARTIYRRVLARGTGKRHHVASGMRRRVVRRRVTHRTRRVRRMPLFI